MRVARVTARCLHFAAFPHVPRSLQELVFIGRGMDRSAIEAALTAALLTDDEFAAGECAEGGGHRRIA